MKDAVHIKTAGFYCGACPKVVEKALTSTGGVLSVVAVRSMGLTSILYDTDIVDRETLCDRIRATGFQAELIDRPEEGKRQGGSHVQEEVSG